MSTVLLTVTHLEEGPAEASRIARALPSANLSTAAFLAACRFGCPILGPGWAMLLGYAAALTNLAAIELANARGDLRKVLPNQNPAAELASGSPTTTGLPSPDSHSRPIGTRIAPAAQAGASKTLRPTSRGVVLLIAPEGKPALSCLPTRQDASSGKLARGAWVCSNNQGPPATVASLPPNSHQGPNLMQITPAERQDPRAPRPGAEPASAIDLDWLSDKIPYRRYQECVHCGLCTASCPTYVETCNENDSPRGRIYLMRAVADGRLEMGPGVREHLELCLDCRACETACPSGVQYGRMIEPFKIALQKSASPGEKTSLLQRLILHHVFPYPGRVKLALAPARLLQRIGALDWAERVGLTRLLPPTLRRMQAMLPKLGRNPGRLPQVLPPIGPKRAGSPSSSVASPTPCFPKPTRQPLVSFSRMDARS